MPLVAWLVLAACSSPPEDGTPAPPVPPRPTHPPLTLHAGTSIPDGVAVTGIVTGIQRWTDDRGDHVVVFTRRDLPAAPDRQAKAIRVTHDLLTPGGARRLREVTDRVEDCPADLTLEVLPQSVGLTDVDGDGLGELAFAYEHGCRSDVSPNGLTLVLLEDGEAWALRGTTRVRLGDPEDVAGGGFTPDPGVAAGPAAVRAHLEATWHAITRLPGEDLAAVPAVADRLREIAGPTSLRRTEALAEALDEAAGQRSEGAARAAAAAWAQYGQRAEESLPAPLRDHALEPERHRARRVTRRVKALAHALGSDDGLVFLDPELRSAVLRCRDAEDARACFAEAEAEARGRLEAVVDALRLEDPDLGRAAMRLDAATMQVLQAQARLAGALGDETHRAEHRLVAQWLLAEDAAQWTR